MHPLVQSALDSANQGNKPKAIELVRQALTSDPNDIDAWLVLAAVVDDPERKRQCLERVLRLDPTNKLAREEILQMDRAHMGGSVPRSQPVAAPVTSAKPEPMISPAPASTYPYETAAAPKRTEFPAEPAAREMPAPKPKPQLRIEKPLVFKFPLFWRVLMYIALAFFGCSGLLVATLNVVNSLPFLGLAFVMGLTIMAFSPKVEISEAGIRASGMFSSAEVKWNDIVRMKSNVMKRKLELYKKNGEAVGVSTQVSGYPRIVEIIRQRRPDLFSLSPSSHAGASGAGSVVNSTNPNASPSFTGIKVFKKNLFAQYGVIILMIPLCLFGVWALVATEEPWVGVVVMLIGLLFMVFSLFAVHQIKVEPGKITTESFFSQKEYTPVQIKDISMKTVRSRRGVATNFVNVQPVQGSAISLAGFSEGDEIIYGILMSWWQSQQNK